MEIKRVPQEATPLHHRHMHEGRELLRVSTYTPGWGLHWNAPKLLFAACLHRTSSSHPYSRSHSHVDAQTSSHFYCGWKSHVIHSWGGNPHILLAGLYNHNHTAERQARTLASRVTSRMFEDFSTPKRITGWLKEVSAFVLRSENVALSIAEP